MLQEETNDCPSPFSEKHNPRVDIVGIGEIVDPGGSQEDGGC